MQQRAGVPLVFDKKMQRGLEVGAGQWLTADHERPCDGDHSADLALPAALPRREEGVI